MDGLSTTSSSGAGLLLTIPEGLDIGYEIWLGFNMINNEAEYEALIARLSLAKEAGFVSSFTNLKLIKGQVTGEYEVKEDQMKKYLTWVTELMSHFEAVSVRHIPKVRTYRKIDWHD